LKDFYQLSITINTVQQTSMTLLDLSILEMTRFLKDSLSERDQMLLHRISTKMLTPKA